MPSKTPKRTPRLSGKPVSAAHTERFTFMLSPAQVKKLHRISTLESVTPSAWLRIQIVDYFRLRSNESATRTARDIVS